METKEQMLLVPVSISKQDVHNRAKVIISMVEEGDVTALDALTRMKHLSDICKESIEGIKEMALSEAIKFNKAETIKVNGAKIELSNKVEYDYSNCNDEDLTVLESQAEQLELKIKERKAFLKVLPESFTVADHQTGEMKTIRPAIKLSEQIVKVTFSK